MHFFKFRRKKSQQCFDAKGQCIYDVAHQCALHGPWLKPWPWTSNVPWHSHCRFPSLYNEKWMNPVVEMDTLVIF